MFMEKYITIAKEGLNATNNVPESSQKDWYCGFVSALLILAEEEEDNIGAIWDTLSKIGAEKFGPDWEWYDEKVE